MTKENKEIREMELNLHVARNHYTLCMHDTEDRKNFIHQFKCQEEECPNKCLLTQFPYYSDPCLTLPHMGPLIAQQVE